MPQSNALDNIIEKTISSLEESKKTFSLSVSLPERNMMISNLSWGYCRKKLVR